MTVRKPEPDPPRPLEGSDQNVSALPAEAPPWRPFSAVLAARAFAGELAPRAGVVLFLLLHALLLYCLAGAVLLPELAGRALAVEISAALGRESRVERIAFNPLTFELTVTGLRILDDSGPEALAGFSRLDLDLDPSAFLTGGGFVLKRLHLEGPRLRLARDGQGRLNVADLLPGVDREEKPAGMDWTLTPPGMRFSVSDVRISDGEAVFDDALTGVRQEVRGLSLDIESLDSGQRGLREIFSGQAQLNESSLSLSVKADLFGPSPEIQARLSARNVVLKRYMPYVLPLKHPVDLTMEEAGLTARLVLPAASGGEPRLEAWAKLGGAALLAGDKAVAGLKSLEVQNATLSPGGGPVRVERLSLEAPFLVLGLDESGAPDILAYLEPRDAPAPAGENDRQGAGAAAPDVFLEALAVSGGEVRLGGPGLGFETAVTGLKVSARELDLAAGRLGGLTLEAGGDLFERLSLNCSGGFRELNLSGGLELDGLDLSRPAPLIRRFSPKLALTGKAGARLAYVVGMKDGRPSPSLTGSLTLAGLKVAVDGQQGALATMQTLSASGLEVKPAARTLKAGQIRLEGGSASLTRDAKGGFPALEALLGQAPGTGVGAGAAGEERGPLAAASGTESPAGAVSQPPARGGDRGKAAAPSGSASARSREAGPWQVGVGQTRLAGVSLDFRDEAARNSLRLDLDEVTAGSFSLGQTAPLAFTAKGRLEKDTSFDLAGEVSPAKPALALNLTLTGLSLPWLARWLPEPAVVPLAGIVSIKGKALAAMGGEGLQADFGGDVEMSGLKLAAPGLETPFLTLAGMRLSGAEVRLSPLSFKASSLILDQPWFALNLDKDARPETPLRPVRPSTSQGAKEEGSAAKPPEEPVQTSSRAQRGQASGKVAARPRTGAAAQAASPPSRQDAPASPLGGLAYSLDRLEVRGGALELTGRDFDPPLWASLSAIQATIQGIRPEAPARLELNLSAGHTGRLAVQGSAGLTSGAPVGEIKATLDNLDLGELSPLSKRFTGFPITRGKLRLGLDFRLDGKSLDMKNRIVVTGIQLGPKSDPPGGKAVPLDLAVSLLTDARGVIDLDIPVKGSPDQAKADLKDVISTAMAGAFAKILFSPLAFLNVAQSGGETAHILFAPGSAELTPEAKKTLTALASAVISRPRLSLEAAAFADQTAEAQALGQVLSQPQGKAAEAQATGQPGQAPPTAGDFQRLARQRLEAVLAFLTGPGKLPQDRLFPVSGDVLKPPPVKGQPGHRADIRLRY